MLSFIKMEGLGNDFILIDGIKNDLSGIKIEELAPKLCDRHYGIGADGVLLVLKSEQASYKMRVINPDGSEPEMCGSSTGIGLPLIPQTSL